MIVISMFLSAFFSGTETAILSAHRLSIEALPRDPGKKRRALYILNNIEDTIGMLLIGNNIANISAAAFITFIATQAYLFDDRQLFVVTLIQTIIFLIFCEVTPKIIARAYAERFLLFFSIPIVIMLNILRPANVVIMFIIGTIKKGFGINAAKGAAVVSRDEINILFKLGRDEGIIEEDHHDFVAEILSIRDVTAVAAMTPTVDIVSINIKKSIKDLVTLFEKTRFSKIPVYKGRVDHIIGYVFYRNILETKKPQNIGDVMTAVEYAPATKSIFDLYMDMQVKTLPVVFIVNEYGGVIGMVTYEDIAEEIVGEINTHDHSSEALITPIDNFTFYLSGNLPVDFFQKKFSCRIEKKGFETMAGFVMYKLGKIPRQGEEFVYNKHVFIIEETTERTVERIKLIVPSRRKKKRHA
jgi:CBS domain containing-hemolysin-like protein